MPQNESPRAKNLILLIVLTGQLMIILDISVVTTALTSIQAALGFSSSSLTWVQNAYALTFGGLLLLGARMGDLLGRRRVFITGIAGFTIASLFGGLAQSSEWLLIARAAQGVFAAIAAPSTLALLQQTFQEPKERARAIGLFSSVLGAGASFGLLIGGLLTDLASWRWGLLINVPIGLALVLAAPRYLPETPRRKGHFDLAGALTSAGGMTALVYGFTRAAEHGWSSTGAIVSFVGAAVLLTTFVFNERKAEQPITPLHLFKSRERSGSHAARMLIVAGIFSMFFFVSQYMQDVLGFSPLQTGLAFLPQTALLFTMVQIVPKFIARIGAARTVAGGVAVALVGMTWLSQIGEHSAYFPGIALPLMLLGLGMGTAFIPLTSLSIVGVDPKDAGAASGLVNVSQQLGGSIGLAGLSTVFASQPDLALGVHAVLMGSATFMALGLLTILLVIRSPKQATPNGEVVLTAEPA